MNMYFVISELLTEVIWESRFDQVGHKESYNIAELVVARTRSQARYIVMRTDKAHSRDIYRDIREMPRLSVRKLSDNFDGPPRLLRFDDKYDDSWWDKTDGMYPPDYRSLQEEDDGDN